MTWLARLSLTNRAVVGLVTALLLVFGAISTTSLRQELIPSLDIPVLTVVTPYAGASPDVVQQQVTSPIEAAVDGVDGVTSSSSTSTNGSSIVTLELEYGTDIDRAATDTERAITSAQLPEDVRPTVSTIGTDAIPVVQLAVSSNLPPDQLAEILRDDVQPLLLGLDGVGDVSLTGIAEPQVTIDVDPAAATERGISLTSIQAVLQNNGVRVPAGQLTPDTNPLTVEVGTPVTAVEQLNDLFVTPGATGAPGAGAPAGGEPVRLGDIATITSAPAPATGFTRTNGVDSIGIGVTRLPEANTVSVSHAVNDELGQITDLIGGTAQNAEVTVVFDQAPFIEQSVEDLTTEGLLGLLFAVLVILGFLMSVRATIVTAVSIPLSVLIAMIVLYLGGYSLNILTLGALTVAVGRVVDDSIVVIENIKRHIGYGGPRRRAILTAIREVAGAITASTITTVAVFAPIGLVGGQVGELFQPFAITVTAALLASLLVSLTVVPVLASLILRSPKKDDGEDDDAAATDPGAGAPREEAEHGRLQRAYIPILHGALARPALSLLLAVVILAGTVALVPLMRTNFLGDAGGDTLTVSQELPPGTGLPQANDAALRIENVLADTEGVESYQVTVGSGGSPLGPPGSSGASRTRYSMTLTEDADAELVTEDLRDRLSSVGTVDEVGTITVSSGQGGFSSNLAVDVRADDPAVLAEAAAQVEQAVIDLDGVTEVRNNLAAEQAVVDVQVNRQAAAEQGLTETQVGQLLAAALRGTPAGTLTVGGVEQDVVLRTGAAPLDVAALSALPVGAVTLGEIATVTETTTAPSVVNVDGERAAEITARPENPDDLGTVTTDLQTALDDLDLPEGATAEIGGVSAEQGEAFAQLGLALLAAIAVVYLVMVVTFRSLLQPLILLVSIPFAATGALGLLLVTGTPLGVPALIGMLMLVGVVVTNAIVLIDLVNQYRRAGQPLYEALIGGATQRLRPILMTAVATIFALIPMALGLTGGGAFISQPLAVVVIGGLVSSTLLTLVLVPVLYLLAEGPRERRRGGPVLPDADPDAPTPGPQDGPTGAAAATPAADPDLLTKRPRDRELVGAGAGAPAVSGASATGGRPLPRRGARSTADEEPETTGIPQVGGVSATGGHAPVDATRPGAVPSAGTRERDARGAAPSGAVQQTGGFATGAVQQTGGFATGAVQRTGGFATGAARPGGASSTGAHALPDTSPPRPAAPRHGRREPDPMTSPLPVITPTGPVAGLHGTGEHALPAGFGGSGAAAPLFTSGAPLPGPGLRGVVTDRDGRALSGAVLTVYADAGAPLAESVSGPDGTYALPVPGPGEYLLAAQSGGREPVAEWVRIGTTTERRDLAVDGPASIAGYVRRAGGEGVAAVVTAMDLRGHRVAGTRADADGRYLLAHIPEGEHRLLVAPPTGPSATRRVSVPETGTVHQDVELAGAPGGEVTGVIRSPQGAPVGGAVATVRDGVGTVVATGRTDADGTFRFTGLPEGDYTVTATTEEPGRVRIRPGDAPTTVELGLTNGRA